MAESWQRRVARAEELASTASATAHLLTFYATLLRVQAGLYEDLRAHPPSGALERDLPALRARVPVMLRAIAKQAPELLASEARRLTASGDAGIDEMLLSYWRAPSDRQFFAKALLQPYAQCLAEAGAVVDRALARANNSCPHCGGTPQLSVLQPAASSLQGGARVLLCATCLTSWPFPRVRCACCGEEDERQLGYFQAAAFDHVRVEACDTCRRYLKGIDRTRVGLAVPIVDEVAGAALDIWAQEQGYQKIELNLVGL